MIKYLLMDKDTHLWAGTVHGVYRLVGEEKNLIRYLSRPKSLNGLNINKTRWLHQGKNETIWVGTEEGLSRLDSNNNRFVSYTEEQGLNGHYICSILEDGRGDLLVSTHACLSRFNP